MINPAQVLVTRANFPAPTHEAGNTCRITGCTNQTSRGVCADCARDILEYDESRLMARTDYERMRTNPHRGPLPSLPSSSG